MHLARRLVPLTAACGAFLSTTSVFGSAEPPVPGYAYTPPLRQSAGLQAAALAAARPRLQVPITPRPRVIFVLGGPGVGKGTQSSLLAQRYGFVHLSAGDLLREERARGGPVADMIEATIREGRIVPVEVTVGLLKAAMLASGKGKFLVDGFPRNFDNVSGWEAAMTGVAELDGMLQYEAPEGVLVARLLERGKSSGRSDDNEESILKRLRTYGESTLPVVEHYTKAGKVTFIDGNRDKEAVFVDSCAAVEQCVRGEVLATNQLLLDAICAGDWEAYAAMVDPDMTCFEPEAGAEGLLRGLGVHRANFEEGAKGRAEGVMRGVPPVWMASTMMEAEARLMGPNHALLTYVRASSPLQGKQGAPVARVAESRVWRFTEAGRWTLMHVHRSPMPALEVSEGH